MAKASLIFETNIDMTDTAKRLRESPIVSFVHEREEKSGPLGNVVTAFRNLKNCTILISNKGTLTITAPDFQSVVSNMHILEDVVCTNDNKPFHYSLTNKGYSVLKSHLHSFLSVIMPMLFHQYLLNAFEKTPSDIVETEEGYVVKTGLKEQEFSSLEEAKGFFCYRKALYAVVDMIQEELDEALKEANKDVERHGKLEVCLRYKLDDAVIQKVRDEVNDLFGIKPEHRDFSTWPFFDTW